MAQSWIIKNNPFQDINLSGDIAQAYWRAVDEENKYRQAIIDECTALGPEEQKESVRTEKGIPAPWPEYCLPLCQWGCNISTYIDAKTEQIFQGMSHPSLFVAASLEEWLERWLAGENLQFL